MAWAFHIRRNYKNAPDWDKSVRCVLSALAQGSQQGMKIPPGKHLFALTVDWDAVVAEHAHYDG
jgi:hypothetical protein